MKHQKNSKGGTMRAEARPQEICGARNETNEAPKVDREIDLKGEVCPYTFVKSLLALEEMEVGEVLRVTVDYPPSAENVPRSLKNEGHEILSVTRIDNTDWEITVRKIALDEGE